MIHIIHNGEKKILFLSNRMEFYKINKHTEELINMICQYKDKNVVERKFNVPLEEVERVGNILKRDTKLATVAKEYPYLRKLILNISNKCNLNCRYCYANGGTYFSKDGLMDEENAREAINKFLYVFGEIEYIQFFGGEPLLNYTLIDFVCEYISNLFKEKKIHIFPRFGIVTNGTIMNDEILRILSKYKIAVTISCDGPQKVNDALRINKNQEGTYQQIVKNIELLKNKNNILPNIEVTYTEYHHNQGIKIPDLLEFFKKTFGIENVHIAPVSLEKSHELALQNYEDFLETISSETIKDNRIIFKVKNLIFNLQHKCGDYKICGAGTDTFSVGVNGQVYPCFMMTDMEDYIVTNVNLDKEIFMEDIRGAKEKYCFNKLVDEPCKDCFNNLLCNGCMGCNVFETKNPFVPSKSQCEFLKGLTEKVIAELTYL